MGSFASAAVVAEEPEFRHEALFYEGEDAFVDATAQFILDARRSEEQALVVVSSRKIDRLRSHLGHDVDGVRFADMEQVGSNPARIIPAWAEFLREHATQAMAVRGVGESIWPERSASEMVECQLHERLLNVAFDEGPRWWLLCPYDTMTLGEGIIEQARRNHRFVQDRGISAYSVDYSDMDRRTTLSDLALAEPRGVWKQLSFDVASLHSLRCEVSRCALECGFGVLRAQEAVTAVNEVATNSLIHAGGRGEVRIWREGETLVFDVCDKGQIDDPLVGRVAPDIQRTHGRGLWMANQLCQLVQVRSSGQGTEVRLHLLPG